MIRVSRQRKSDDDRPTGDVEIAVCRMLVKIGFSQHRIAALFGCNQGRINETHKGTDPVEWCFRVGSQSIKE